MQSSITGVIPDKLQQLKIEIENYRSLQGGKKSLPQNLWDKAISVLEQYQYSARSLSHYLEIDYKRLLDNAKSKSVVASENIKPKKAFLELKSCELSQIASLPSSLGVNHTEQSCKMVFERRDGNKLSIEIPIDLAMIEAITNQFLRA